MPAAERNHRLKEQWVPLVIGIQEGDQIAGAFADSAIAGCPFAPVRLSYQPKSRIAHLADGCSTPI
jgi:hypothetical protein